jgi:monoamine oxidase
MSKFDADVIIIGAGAAGLAAARTLSGAGLRVLIFEARDRIGGRIHTLMQPGTLLPIELGAEFVHGTPAETWDIIRAGRLLACDVTDTHWFLRGGKLSQDPRFWEETETVFKRVGRMKEPDLSFAEFLRRYCADIPQSVKELALAFAEGFDAADTERASTRALVEEQEASADIEEDRSFRLLNGYSQLIDWLAAGLDPHRVMIQLKTIVTRIRWEKGSSQVSYNSGDSKQTIRARHVLVTLPLGVLKAVADETGAVHFEPELPDKTAAIAKLEMGTIVKIILRFREPFWEREQFPTLEKGQSLRDAGFLHTHGLPVFTWWTMLPVRSNILVGWSGGPAAQALSHRTQDEVIVQALASLSIFLGVTAESLSQKLEWSRVADWQADPFSRGAYSYTGVGGNDARAVLARPVEGTLFFAGEATHEGQSGTVAGAISTGYRAAEEILGERRRE